MKALIKTKSNYRNLNGQILEVKEIVNGRVSCSYKDEFNRDLTIDFGLSEVKLQDKKAYEKDRFGTGKDLDTTEFLRQPNPKPNSKTLILKLSIYIEPEQVFHFNCSLMNKFKRVKGNCNECCFVHDMMCGMFNCVADKNGMHLYNEMDDQERISYKFIDITDEEDDEDSCLYI